MNVRQELRAFWSAARALDRQAVVVLVLAAVLAVLQYSLGDRDLYRSLLGGRLPEAWDGLMAWGWWFAVQGVLGFVIPVLVLLVGFRRRPSEIGLGLGDARFAGTLALLYLPLVAVGTWLLSSRPDFQSAYPHYGAATGSWRIFWAYEALFLFYWMGWEYLWRGFVLFGTARALGLYAILVQAVPLPRCTRRSRGRRRCCPSWAAWRSARSAGGRAPSGSPSPSTARRCSCSTFSARSAPVPA